MIVEYIRYDLKQHSPDELIAAYRRAGEQLRASPECLGFELTQCEEAATALILRIVWTSMRDHLEGFRKGANFSGFLAAIQPFMGEIAEMRHYAQTGVEWAR